MKELIDKMKDRGKISGRRARHLEKTLRLAEKALDHGRGLNRSGLSGDRVRNCGGPRTQHRIHRYPARYCFEFIGGTLSDQQ